MPAGIQLRLGIEDAPPILREHGLREAHTHPLVSAGKTARPYWSKRVPASAAWNWPQIEYRTANSYPVLILDVDGAEAMARIDAAIFGGQVPVPNWVTLRPSSGGAHVAWTLERPVHYGPEALVAPLRVLTRVGERFSQVIGADAGYTGVLAHNAAYPGAEFVTEWLAREPHSLAGLRASVPADWRAPARTELRSWVGRNCGLFERGMQWAGSVHHRHMDVWPVISTWNDEYEHPLPLSEVGSISASIDRYRARWWAERSFWHPPTREEQAHRGRLSGIARRERKRERDRELIAWREAGCSYRDLASMFELTVGAAHWIVKRGVQ